ncbi:hypothetical protein FRB99_006342 [Tulasnella sp. 403]|nr:hypothetical protein FRB99_006342 [Tulasnella sp. 403]
MQAFPWMDGTNEANMHALRSPVDPSRRLVKRIVGVENDIVRTLPPFPQQTTQVPVGHVWVEGDEPFVSHDSNRFGPVRPSHPQHTLTLQVLLFAKISTGLIEAKINYIIWPLSRIGRVAPAPARHKDRVFTFSDLIKRSAGGSGTIVRLDDKPSPAQQNLSAASTP